MNYFSGLILSTCLFIPSLGFCEEISDLIGKYRDHNVVLLTFDAMRPDHLGCYGYNKNTSPAIDALAEQGILFLNAFSQASSTVMNVPSIYTSLYPRAHGVRHIYKDHLSPRVLTLAEILRSHGYQAVWFGPREDPPTGSMPGLLDGFDLASDTTVDSWIENNAKKKFFITLHSYTTHDYSFIFQKNNEFLKQRSERIKTKHARLIDFLLNWTEAALESFFEVIDDGAGSKWLQNNKDGIRKRLRILKQKNFSDQIEKNKLRDLLIRGFYSSLNIHDMPEIQTMLDNSIYHIDQYVVKTVIDTLRKNALLDKTIIIITADHGNEFMEHGRFGHGAYTYDESIRIPLIFYIPQLLKPERIESLAESVDILPTVLDLLGIPIPSQAQGISLIKAGNTTNSGIFKEYVISESIAGDICLRSSKWKLIGKIDPKKDIFTPRELYNLQNDPGERTSVIKENPAIADQMRKILLLKIAAMQKYRDVDRHFLPIVDEESRKRIIKTGYW